MRSRAWAWAQAGTMRLRRFTIRRSRWIVFEHRRHHLYQWDWRYLLSGETGLLLIFIDDDSSSLSLIIILIIWIHHGQIVIITIVFIINLQNMKVVNWKIKILIFEDICFWKYIQTIYLIWAMSKSVFSIKCLAITSLFDLNWWSESFHWHLMITYITGLWE